VGSNILDIEERKRILYSNLSKNPSLRKQVLLFYDFFSFLSQFSDHVMQSYALEFIGPYVNSLKHFTPFYFHPLVTDKILSQINSLTSKDFLESYIQSLKEVKIKLTENLNVLEKILDGEVASDLSSSKVYFPLLEDSSDNDTPTIGILETLTIQIKKTKDANKFIIVPSEKEIEERMKTQIENSWSAAEKIIGNYFGKMNRTHQVIVQFDQKEGIYIGDSLGSALTIGFIEELLKFYNAAIQVNIKTKSAFTGGVNSYGVIKSVSEKIIEDKVKCVFYSDIQTFVVPIEDEKYANEKLEELKREFPQRNLIIIGVRSLDDILDRRKIVDIKRQPIVVRAAKFSRKNWVSLSLMVILFSVIMAAGWLDFDTNPTHVEFRKDIAYIENKNGKVLWNFRTMTNDDGFLFNYAVRFTDINNDGINEVIISDEYYNERDENSNYGRVACFDNHKQLLWKYNFHDTVSSATFEGINIYRLYIIGIVEEGDEKVVYIIAKNRNLYPSAIFKLDAKTGKRIDSLNTLWNAGTITNALIGDFNNDGKPEIVATAVHNGFQRSVLFSVDLDNLRGQTPAPPNYTFANKKMAVLNTFIILPKSDYSDLYYRYDEPLAGSLTYSSVNKKFKFDVIEGIQNPSEYGYLNYVFDNKLRLVYLGCGDDFQMKRDSLVAHGILKPPYSNTPEYMNSLKKQIRYWNGKELVTIKDYYGERRNKKQLEFAKK
jgi:hypothetical protein